jgi:hypothetical protein
MAKFFKITDFAKEIGKHANTVDNWFKLLEEKRLHYVSRVDNEKVYDEIDLDIAFYIRDKRNDKWALDAICNELADDGAPFELRPFPPELEPTAALQVLDMDSIRKAFGDEIRAIVEDMAATQVAELRKQHEEMLQLLPPPRDPAAERLERINEILARRSLERALEKEALHKWATKPEEERMRRVGLFKKEEDRDKRVQFVKEYIDEHFESQLLAQFDQN